MYSPTIGTGKEIKYVQISGEQFMAVAPFPPHFKQEFLDMLLYFDEFTCKLYTS